MTDCATLLGASKLSLLDSLDNSKGPGPSTTKQPSSQFHYLSLPTLSHLLSQIIHPPSTFPPPKTSLLVLDNLNTLLDLDFPRTGYSSATRSEPQKWQSNRRYSILGSLITSLNKLALLHDLAVIVTTGCNSKMRQGEGAAVGPGVGGSEWEAGIHTRIVVFRDFGGRFVGVQKVNGRNLMPLDPVSDIRNVIGFEIGAGGRLREREVDLTSSSSHANQEVRAGAARKAVAMEQKLPVVPATVRKRVYDEIADSEEDEDVDEYGWAERDDADAVVVDPPPLPPVPPVNQTETAKDVLDEQIAESAAPTTAEL